MTQFNVIISVGVVSVSDTDVCPTPGHT
jgi:hypothetical protein